MGVKKCGVKKVREKSGGKKVGKKKVGKEIPLFSFVMTHLFVIPNRKYKGNSFIFICDEFICDDRHTNTQTNKHTNKQTNKQTNRIVFQ